MASIILRKMLATAAAVGFAAVTGSAEVINTSGTVTRSDNITGGLTKQGTGTLLLTGEDQSVTGDFETQAGTSKVEGSLSVSGTVGVNSAGTIGVSGSLISNTHFWMNPGAQAVVDGNLTVANIFTVKGGRLRQTGGNVRIASSESEANIGGRESYEKSAYYTGVYEMRAGTLFVQPNFQIGRYGPGSFIQTGGEVEVRGTPCVARYSTGAGSARYVGGVFNQVTSYNGYIVGEEGPGELEVSGAAEVDVCGSGGLNLGLQTTGSGVMHLNGGVLSAQKILGGKGDSSVILNGGTLKARVDSPTFVSGVKTLTVGPCGCTVDTDGHAVTIAQPMTEMSTGAKMVHRWSFNGTWTDSIGGKTAIKDGNVTFNANSTACVLPGGAKGAGAVNLGADVLPTGDRGFTLEFWMTENAAQNWSRVFQLGSNGDSIWMAWSYGTLLYRDVFAVERPGATTFSLTAPLGGFEPLGTEYHVAVSVAPKGDGTYRFSVYKQDAVTGETMMKAEGDAPSGWTPATQNASVFWLGRSLSNDPDASASYNEVRVWDSPLGEQELSYSARRGADASEGAFVKDGQGCLTLSGVNTFTTPVRVEAGMLELPSGATLSAPVTVAAGGVLSVASDSVPSVIAIEVSATEKLAGCLEANGSALNLSALSVTVANVADLNPDYSYVIARSSEGFVGALDATGLPKGWQYVVRGNEVRLCIPRGLAIILR